MSKYEVFFGDSLYAKERSKDDVIQLLMGYINGDGVVDIKVVYPDGSYYHLTGEDE